MLSPNSFLPSRSVRKLRWSCDGGGAEIAEHLAHQVEHRGRFQDHGVAARRQSPRDRATSAPLSLALRASADRIESRCDATADALAHPELSSAMAVIENCAMVSLCSAATPRN